jgi:hypothetical protein
LILFRFVNSYYETVVDVINGKMGKVPSKLPPILCLVLAGLNGLFGIFLLVNMTFVSALFSLSIALYTAVLGIYYLKLCAE